MEETISRATLVKRWALIALVLIAVRLFFQARLEDLVVALGLLYVLLWRSEGAVTLYAGSVIAVMYGILRLARPAIVIPHLWVYAIGMIFIGGIGAVLEYYAIFSPAFWEEFAQQPGNPWLRFIALLVRDALRNVNSIGRVVKIKAALGLLGFTLVLFVTNASVLLALLVGYGVAALAFGWRSRGSVLGLAFALASLPVLILLDKEMWAEAVANGAFYLLVVVMLQEARVLFSVAKTVDK